MTKSFSLLSVKILLISLSILLLTNCSVEQSVYKSTTPTFDLKTYFSGPVTAWGYIKDYKNQVNRRFCVELEGTWQAEGNGHIGLLAEKFYFDDGEITYRNWQLTQLSNGEYVGSAEDVVGVAKGHAEGLSFRWQYTLALTVDDESYELKLDDWLYQMDEYRVFNQTDLKKFGVTVATLNIFFDKQVPIKRCES